MTAKEARPCEAAHKLVRSLCMSECEQCSVDQAGCMEQTASFRFRMKFKEADVEEDRSHIRVPAMATLLFCIVLAPLPIAWRSWRSTNPRRNMYLNLLDREEEEESSDEAETWADQA